MRDLAYGDGSQFIRSWNMATIRDRVIARGYTLDQLNATIMEYTNLQLWQVTDNQTRLEFCNTLEYLMKSTRIVLF